MTFASAGDAQDAIDNMDLNELRGRVLKVNIARPMKAQPQLQGNRAGKFILHCSYICVPTARNPSLGIGGMA